MALQSDRLRAAILAALAIFAVAGSNPASAQKKYDQGASDTEIKIGNIMPYSGPASAYGNHRQNGSRLFQQNKC